MRLADTQLRAGDHLRGFYLDLLASLDPYEDGQKRLREKYRLMIGEDVLAAPVHPNSPAAQAARLGSGAR